MWHGLKKWEEEGRHGKTAMAEAQGNLGVDVGLGPILQP